MSKSNEEKSANNKAERSIFGGCLYFVMTEWRLMKDKQVVENYRSFNEEVDPKTFKIEDTKSRDRDVIRYTEPRQAPPSKETAAKIGRAICKVIKSRYSDINAFKENDLDLLRLYECLMQQYKSLKDLRDTIKNDDSASLEHKLRLSYILQLARDVKDIRTFILQHQNDYFKAILEDLAKFSEDLILYAHDVHMKVENGSNPIKSMSQGDSERKNNPSQQEATVIKQERRSGGGTVGKMVGQKKPFVFRDKWVSALRSAQSENDFFAVVYDIANEMIREGVSVQAIIEQLVRYVFPDKDKVILESAALRDRSIISSMYFVFIMIYCQGLGCFDRRLYEGSLKSNIETIENILNGTEIST